MKVCTKCKIEKDVSEFRKNKNTCKVCLKVIYKEWYESNKEKKRQASKEWRESNKEKARQASKEWRIYKYNNDEYYRMQQTIRERFRKAIKLYSKNGKTQSMKEYGIDIKAIYEKLGDMPQDGKVYHIDHIFPVSAFDLDNPEHIKLCWYPDNLRWLEASENISKNNKYDKVLFEEYIKKVK